MFTAIKNDIIRRRLRRGKVTIFFGGFASSEFTLDHRDNFNRIYEHMATLMRNDVLIHVTAGNDAAEVGHSQVDTFPAIWASDDFPVLVAGSVDKDGKKAVYSQAGNVVDIGTYTSCLRSTEIYKDLCLLLRKQDKAFVTEMLVGAPAVSILCAGNEDNQVRLLVRGDCFGTCKIHGVMLSISIVADNFKPPQYLQASPTTGYPTEERHSVDHEDSLQRKSKSSTELPRQGRVAPTSAIEET